LKDPDRAQKISLSEDPQPLINNSGEEKSMQKYIRIQLSLSYKRLKFLTELFPIMLARKYEDTSKIKSILKARNIWVPEGDVEVLNCVKEYAQSAEPALVGKVCGSDAGTAPIAETPLLTGIVGGNAACSASKLGNCIGQPKYQ
jgi:hypothetical protein